MAGSREAEEGKRLNIWGYDVKMQRENEWDGAAGCICGALEGRLGHRLFHEEKLPLVKRIIDFAYL